jgi:hypothetical protein
LHRTGLPKTVVEILDGIACRIYAAGFTGQDAREELSKILADTMGKRPVHLETVCRTVSRLHRRRRVLACVVAYSALCRTLDASDESEDRLWKELEPVIEAIPARVKGLRKVA